MCGIAGAFAYNLDASDVDASGLSAINNCMAARGPDGSGLWISPTRRVGLAHRRLAIIDLSENGAQPMFSADGKLGITFNGEIYNYEALREEMRAQGCAFRSDSDTEVLLALYASKGEAMVHDLRGMFAFAIWDSERNGIFLARDPYGIKPLYYSDDGRRVVFGSQVKALLASNWISRTPDAAGWLGYYLMGSVPEPFTTFSAIRSLEAGSTLWIGQDGVHHLKKYFSIASVYREAEQRATGLSPAEVERLIKDELLDTVRHHLVADVPVGAFLSGGIDSGTLVGLMWELGKKDIPTITIAFSEFEGSKNDESRLSAVVADRYGTRHTRRLVTEEEFQNDLPKIIAAMDQPTIDGINSWFAAKAAKELGLKVIISGLGGDELFRGYPSFRNIPLWMRWAKVLKTVPAAKAIMRQLVVMLNARRTRLNPKSQDLIEYAQSYEGSYLLCRGLFLPPDLGSVLEPDAVAAGLQRLNIFRLIDDHLSPVPNSAMTAVAILESSLYMRNQLLRDMDWASMAHGVEVRVPLVDSKLLHNLAGIVETVNTTSWKDRLASSPLLPLPASVVKHSKTGFNTPVSDWLQRDRRISRWRRIPKLSQSGTPWARRWAYEVAQIYRSATDSGAGHTQFAA